MCILHFQQKKKSLHINEVVRNKTIYFYKRTLVSDKDKNRCLSDICVNTKSFLK